MASFDIILATDKFYGYGYYNDKTNTFSLPWKNNNDMKFFTKTTMTEDPTKKM